MKKSIEFTILHIDDDEANRYSVKRILEKHGHQVIEAMTGGEGLIEAENNPDLILLDIKLPDMTGYEVCRILKANPQTSSIPVLQTSAQFVTSEDKVEGLDSGADGYLVQPIDPAVLVATIKSLLRTRMAEKEAQAATRSRDEMMAIVSHDLRNPLAAVMLQVKLMNKALDAKGEVPDLKDKLARIANSCNRMNRLIQDLLDVTSIEGGNFKINQGHFSVGNLLLDTLNGFEEIAESQGIELVHHIGNEEDTAFGDRERIHQLLMNLIANSIKFTPKGGKITVRSEQKVGETLISVEDTGVGIPAEAIPHLFNRYWQGRKDNGRQGIGLGLSIVKGIVDAHHGKIWVESVPDQGSKFTVQLPSVE